MTDVFISYSRKNAPFARRLTDRLRQSGKDSWVDWEGIPLSSPNWWEEITSGIDKADNFVFIMSKDSMESVVCNMELDYALDYNKRVIVVVYEDVERSESFASFEEYVPDPAMQERLGDDTPMNKARDNWVRISHINWLFFRESDDFNGAYEKLLDTVATDLNYVKSHTRYLDRAREWKNLGEREDLLLFGDEITLAEDWLETGNAYKHAEANRSASQKVDYTNPLPDDLHRDYIQASREAEETRQRSLRTLRRVGVGASIIGVAAILISIFAGFGLFTANRALAGVPITLEAVETQIQAQQNESDGRALALRARDLANSNNPFLALSLALEASFLADTPQTTRILSELMQESRARQRYVGQAGTIWDVAFNTDGTLMASASQDELVIWDVQTGEMRHQFQHITDAETVYPHSVMFSPVAPIVYYGNVGDVVARDADSGDIVQKFEVEAGLADRVAPIIALDVSADGQILLAGDIYGIVMIFDMATGRVVQVFDAELEADSIYSASFNDDASEARIITPAGRLIIWNIRTGEALVDDEIANFTEGDGFFALVTNQSAAINSAGTMIAWGTREGTIILWDIVENQEIRRLSAHDAGILRLQFSPDGSQLLAGSFDNTMTLWDVETGTHIYSFAGHSSTVSSIAFSPDGTQLASGSVDSSIILWDLIGSAAVASASHVVHTTISPNNDVIVNILCVEGADDRCAYDVQITDTQGTEIQTYADIFTWDGADDLTIDTSFGSDGDWLLIGRGNAMSNLETTRSNAEYGLIERYLGGGGGGGGGGGPTEVILLNIRTGEVVTRYEFWFERGVEFHPDGQHFFVGGAPSSTSNYGIYLVDIDSGDIIREYPYPWSSFSVSPDGQRLLIESWEGLRILDVDTTDEIRHFEGYEGRINAIDYNPNADMPYVVSGGGIPVDSAAELILWDTETEDEVRRFIGHTDVVTAVAFSPDGRRLLSGDADGNVILWDVETGEMLNRFMGHRAIIREVVFAPDGEQIISVALDGEQIIWRNASREQLQQWILNNRYIRDLTCEERENFGARPCAADVAPESLPLTTRTPLPLSTAVQTTSTPYITPTISPTPTITPSITPSPTALSLSEISIGELSDSIDGIGSRQYRYQGQGGEVIHIVLIAEGDGSALYIRDSTFNTLRAIFAVESTIQERNFTLPDDGEIIIEVVSRFSEGLLEYNLSIENAED